MAPRNAPPSADDVDREVYGEIAREKAAERAANDAKRARLEGQIAGKVTAINNELTRLARLVQARAGIQQLVHLNGVKRDFGSLFIGKMYEAPETMRVDVTSRDWAGHSAVAFARQHTDVSAKLATAASASIAAITTYRTKLDESDRLLAAAGQLCEAKIAEAQNNIRDLNDAIQSLAAQIRAIPN